MKALHDPSGALARGLAAIRHQFDVPGAFPAEVLAAAELAAKRAPTAHVDRTGEDFVTLDPASSTDLDQAFRIEAAGGDLLLHYAIADVAWFVQGGDPLDVEAWKRGVTVYLPDGKAPLYPPVLSENAASLLPGGPRPAVVFTVRVDPAGMAKLDAVERALIVNRSKFAYETAQVGELPAGFAAFSARIHGAEAARGAARVDPPEQEVEAADGGGYALVFRPRSPVEDGNAALSLACNLAVASALFDHQTGLFRVMAAPDPRALGRLQHTARALKVEWPRGATLTQFEKRLDGAIPAQAAMMSAIRRAGSGASYEPYTPGVTPWHAAIAGTYVHATAPLRRLADRYVCQAALAVANSQPVPAEVAAAFAALPKVMDEADMRSNGVDRAVIDLAEAVVLTGREGEKFKAVVTDIDERGARIQLMSEAVVSRVPAHRVEPGQEVDVRLVTADTERRLLTFERLG